MDPPTQVLGKTKNSMEEGQRSGKTVLHMKENIRTALSKGRACSHGMMVLFT